MSLRSCSSEQRSISRAHQRAHHSIPPYDFITTAQPLTLCNGSGQLCSATGSCNEATSLGWYCSAAPYYHPGDVASLQDTVAEHSCLDAGACLLPGSDRMQSVSSLRQQCCSSKRPTAFTLSSFAGSSLSRASTVLTLPKMAPWNMAAHHRYT